MDNEIYEVDHDVIVLGTGIKECILTGLLSLKKLQVLNVDRNQYYGAESASVNLDTLFQKFRGEDAKPNPALGHPRKWNVDLCPKFIMASGNLVKMLIQTNVTRYLELASVGGSFVYQGGSVHKVPSTAAEALTSSLLGFFEKRRFKKFLEYVQQYDEKVPATHQGFDALKSNANDLFQQYSLSPECIEFTGHCIALHHNDDYLSQPALDTIQRCRLYGQSLAQYGKSSFIYPHYGIGGIPEGFARLCAINGGVQMLGKDVDRFEYDAEGKVCGVFLEGDDRMLKTKAVLADPSFVLKLNKAKADHKIIRSVCIFKHPVDQTSSAESCQIIIPAKQTGRKNDIYIAVVSDMLSVCPAKSGYFIAVVSTVKEGTSSEVKDLEKELGVALSILGKIEERFTWESDHYVPTDDGTKDNVYVTSSLDATSHFESATEEVIKMFPLITKTELDLSIDPEIKSDE